ncbi:MAG: methyltransferase domain-containing protein [Oscillospiraceae bacterium]
METGERKRYAEQWAESSVFFYNNKDYAWMCNQIEQYNTVLEIGCGTGHSTLSLVEHGHKVIAIEKNEYCLEKAKALMESNGYICGALIDEINNCKVIFVLADVCDADFLKNLYVVSLDVVVCWNIGTYWSKNMIEFYKGKFLRYGLTLEQIKENPESSYGEFIQWQSCNIAKKFGVPIHLIDRNQMALSEKNDPYYVSLKDEFAYLKIEYNYKKTVSKSLGGRPLTDGQQICSNKIVELFLISILLTKLRSLNE